MTLFFFCLYKMNRQTDLKGQQNFILFYFDQMWRTLPPFWLQTVFSDFVFLWEQLVLFCYVIWIITSLISEYRFWVWKLHTDPLRCELFLHGQDISPLVSYSQNHTMPYSLTNINIQQIHYYSAKRRAFKPHVYADEVKFNGNVAGFKIPMSAKLTVRQKSSQ